MVEMAEAQVLASSSRRFDAEARTLLERALELQPDNQRGLWLLGIAEYQAQHYDMAAEIWERLLAGLPAEADARQALMERIADARQRAGLDPLVSNMPSPEPSAPASPAPVAASSGGGEASAKLTVSVDITPELRSQVGASDVLFIYARAASGPRMPLAIQRLPAASLPVTVTLDDSTSMMPSLTLSSMPQVVVGARISRSGQAAAQSGDLETLSDPIANTHNETLRLTIDRVVP
jgi:cytochrome c-type biogenesis protein CcmH